MSAVANFTALARTGDSLRIVGATAALMAGTTFHHHYHVLYDLRTILGAEEMTYLEIGSFCGGSLALMMQHPLKTAFFSIDPLSVYPEQEAHFKANVAQFNQLLQPHTHYRGLSTDLSIPAALRNAAVSVDILFIDGCHLSEMVLFDWKTYAGFVRPGGFVVFDDYTDHKNNHGVRPAVDAIVMQLDPELFEVWGTIPNYARAPPHSMVLSNEFVIRKV